MMVMFCVKCGQRLPDDSVFCIKCGEKVVIADIDTTTKTIEPDKHNDTSANKIGVNYGLASNKAVRVEQEAKSASNYVMLVLVVIIISAVIKAILRS